MNQNWNRQNYKLPVLAVMILAAGLLLLSGCSGKGASGGTLLSHDGNLNESVSEEKKFRVVTTLFPYYDFTRQIAGEQLELSLVIPAGMDSHSFEPTPADIRLIQNADLLICNGGVMEQWVSRVLSSLDTSGLTVITMMDYVDTVEEELVEGMEDAGHDHEGGDHVHAEADHTDSRDEDESHYEIEYDEHIWTSPVNAMKITAAISETLQEQDREHKEIYEANTQAYLKKLGDLDRQFRQIVSEEKRDIMIMGDKFPLRYFADEYGLRYRAAFSGCANDAEPSAKTIAYLIDKVEEEQIPAVYYLELSSHRVAEIIGEETGAEPLLFHSCHNVTRREFENGVTYLDLMEKNVENLRRGLCE